MARSDNSNLPIDELRKREEEELAVVLAQKYGIGYIDLTRVSINTDALRLIPEDQARTAEAAAFETVGKHLSLAVRSPQHKNLGALLEDLSKRGYIVQQFMVSKQSLTRAWGRYKDLSFAVETKEGIIDVSQEALQTAINTIHGIADIQKSVAEVTELKRAYRISRILEVVLAGAFASDASDIHIEPEQADTKMRYRLDGVLHDVTRFDRETHELLISRLKLLSGLKLNVKDKPQDGRFTVTLHNQQIEVRTSVIPGAYGETVVMRLLNPDTISVPFEELGMEARLKELIDLQIRKPNGMLLNTGPTGSGKSTTLYACLKRMYSPEVKIITIEDPVEYHVQGIVQTQVDQKNYTFLQGLRSALRQDPDIIMVGEIRDEEVARTAIDAALTGHFVFSTIHTNNAAGTFPRLIDLGCDPKVFSSAVNVAMAQRLVRRLCKTCKKQVPIPEKYRERVRKVLEGLRDKSLIPKDAEKVYEPVGCSDCNNTGYKGRIGVFEALIVDEEFDKLLRTSPSEREIQDIQQKRELLMMNEDGVLKSFAGVTSLDEVDRVVLIESGT